MPLRNGDWMFFTSAVDAAPQRTASRKASSLSGASKPLGTGRATFSTTFAPGSISQMICTSSPRPSSSTEESVSRCCGPATGNCIAGVGRLLGLTSFTTHGRERTCTSCPCSGGAVVVMGEFLVRGGLFGHSAVVCPVQVSYDNGVQPATSKRQSGAKLR